MSCLSFFVPGRPRPQGSKRAVMPKGGSKPIMVEQVKGLDDWRANVTISAQRALKDFERLDGPAVLSVEFRFLRPGTHYGRRKGEPYLKPTAPKYVTRTPDLSKLVRAVEDALTDAGVWTDDSRVVSFGDTSKVYVDRYTETEGAQIEVCAA